MLRWPPVSSAGEEGLHRYLSSERIPAIAEEAPPFQPPYRPASRGVDHIRGSRCLIDLHNSATIPYQEDSAKKNPPAPASKPPAAETSVLGNLISRLKLLTH